MSGQSLLEKKVGQLFMVGLPRTNLGKQEINLLSRIGVGGVILFRHNYESLPQLVELCNDVQKVLTVESHEGLPAFIAVDQEGGRVVRFGAPFTPFPSASMTGSLNSPKTAFEVGYVIGKELSTCGVNVNFSPVIDVPEALDKSAIGDRAFSTESEVVANMGSAVIRGLQKGGVIGVAKHFPGHGAVNIDSHVDLPICHKTLEELEAKEWIPFRRLIRSRAEGIMTAHIMFPGIDPERPATMSRKILQDYLRKSLRHSKLIFSDDLEMGAIQKKYTLKDACFLSIEAGCDQVLLCHDLEALEDCWSYIVKAFDTGALNIKRLDESLERIKDAKKRFLLPFSFANKELAEVLVGAPDFLAVAQAVKDQKPVEIGPSAKVKE